MHNIHAFRAFVRLVDTGSFTAVAQELGVKQSTVSKWVSGLEESFSSQLIHRTTRSQQVTDSGRVFYARARAVLDAYDATVAAMRDQDTEVRGRIRLSLPVVFGRLFIVPLVTSFLRKHSEVEVAMHFGDHYSGLVDEGIDLAVRVGAPVDSSLLSHYLGTSSRRVAASPGYLKRCGTPRTPASLAKHECLGHSQPGAPNIWSFSKGKKSERIAVRARVSADNSEVTLALARSGLGICMLASWLVDGDIRAGRLIPLLESYGRSKAPIRALTPPGRHVPGHVRLLIEHLRVGLEKPLAS